MSAVRTRRLYVVRHGEAAPPRGGGDFERPLTPRGREQAGRLGPLVADAPPAIVLASPARRTAETAEAFVRSAAGRLPAPAFDERIYAADVATLLAVLTEISDSVAVAALVGHNPGVSDLTRVLLRDDSALGSIVPGTLVALDVRAAWSSLGPGVAALARFEAPA